MPRRVALDQSFAPDRRKCRFRFSFSQPNLKFCFREYSHRRKTKANSLLKIANTARCDSQSVSLPSRLSVQSAHAFLNLMIFITDTYYCTQSAMVLLPSY